MSTWTKAGQYGPEGYWQVGPPVAPAVGVTVTVKNAGTNVNASLYTDSSKGQAAANPTSTDSDGNLVFWTDPGLYDLVFPSGTLRVVVPPDPSEIRSTADTALMTANRRTVDYVLALADIAKVVGTILELYQYGAGDTTVVAAAGVTVHSPGGNMIMAGQYAGATLRKIAVNEWALEGDLRSPAAG
jgi:hypothetical protein